MSMLHPKQYRKKSVVVEAMQWTGEEANEQWLAEFMGGSPLVFAETPRMLLVQTPNGGVYATVGEWIIKGVKGEFYPCKPDIFEQTYEESDGEDGTTAILNMIARVQGQAETAEGRVRLLDDACKLLVGVLEKYALLPDEQKAVALAKAAIAKAKGGDSA